MSKEEPTAIEAAFIDTRRVSSRSTYKLVFEVDESMQDHVHKILGWPKADGSVRVGIVRLNNNAGLDWRDMERAKAGEVKTVLLSDEKKPAFLENMPEET